MRKLLGFSLFLAGCILFFYPAVNTWYMDWKTERYIEDFENEEKKNQSTEDHVISDDNASKVDDPLYQQMKLFNEKIYQDGQKDFCDAWSYTQSPISLKGLESDRFGYIEIDAMDIKLPLYVGATTENLSKGAAILGQTSYPIGGDNTNSVIAAHRGYHGAPFFREIEKLQLGDTIKITNPWESLYYKVMEIKVINPNDSDEVRIQKGNELITLCTCHPYRSHGKQRYCVYCERTEGEMQASGEKEDKVTSHNTVKNIDHSDKDIMAEQFIYHVGMLLFVIILAHQLIGKIRDAWKKR